MKIHEFTQTELDYLESVCNFTETETELLHLRQKNIPLDSYDGIFLILDEEDRFEGETMLLPESLCVTIRFHSSHVEAPAQYQKLLAYIRDHKLKINGFSREITMIDYGLTNDLSKFVTEISIPVACE